MEDVTKIAKAYYANLSDKEKQSATDIFKTIDKDRDGKISFEEYEEYFNKKYKFSGETNKWMMDFDEFISLLYLGKSPRGRCQGCKVLPAGTYFTCVPCFENASGDTFDLCCDCYGKIRHHHNQHSEFLDNHTLLRFMRTKNKDPKNVKNVPVRVPVRSIQSTEQGKAAVRLAASSVQLAASSVQLATSSYQLATNSAQVVQVAAAIASLCTIM